MVLNGMIEGSVERTRTGSLRHRVNPVGIMGDAVSVAVRVLRYDHLDNNVIRRTVTSVMFQPVHLRVR